MAAALRIVITMVVCALWSAPAVPADIAFVGSGKNGDCTIKLADPIVKGDAEKLKQALAAQRRKQDTTGDYPPPVLCLNSSGGDYNEGLSLIDVVSGYDGSIRTHVPAGASCDSACALVFLAGRFLGDEDSVFPWRTISAKAKRLGFHRPEIIDRSKLPRSEFSGEELINAQGAGVNAVARLLERGNKGQGSQFPTSLLVEALKRRASELFEIDTIDEIGRWDIGLTDFVSPGKITAKDAEQACTNDEMWSSGGQSRVLDTFGGPVKRGKVKGADFFIFTGYLAEGTSDCLIVSRPGRPATFDVYMDSFPQQGGFETSVIEEAAATKSDVEDSPIDKQAWYGLPPGTKFSSLAGERPDEPQSPKAETAAIDKQPSPAGEGKAAKDFVLIENSDLDADMVGKSGASSMEACAKLCRAKKECKAFTFNIWNSVCFLKGRAAARRLEPSSISGLRQPAGKPSASSDDVVMERYRKKAFPNAPFETRKVSDESACYSECEASRKCVAYTFKKENRSCNLLARASEYFGDDTADSGVKRQK